jgi:hypothetical protein
MYFGCRATVPVISQCEGCTSEPCIMWRGNILAWGSMAEKTSDSRSVLFRELYHRRLLLMDYVNLLMCIILLSRWTEDYSKLRTPYPALMSCTGMLPSGKLQCWTFMNMDRPTVSLLHQKQMCDMEIKIWDDILLTKELSIPA